MYSTRGLPPCFRAGAVIAVGGLLALPAPTVFRVAGGTWLTAEVMAAEAEAEDEPLVAVSGPPPPASLATTRTATNTTTAPTAEAAITTRRRSVRACSARSWTTFSWAATSLFSELSSVPPERDGNRSRSAHEMQTVRTDCESPDAWA